MRGCRDVAGIETYASWGEVEANKGAVEGKVLEDETHRMGICKQPTSETGARLLPALTSEVEARLRHSKRP